MKSENRAQGKSTKLSESAVESIHFFLGGWIEDLWVFSQLCHWSKLSFRVSIVILEAA